MHYGYVLGKFPFESDLIRVRTDIIDNEESSYFNWIKEKIRKNVLYVQWIREIFLASSGISSNPALGCYLKDFQMPLDNLAYTMETIPGTFVGFAQCHDHPFEQYTQKEFQELASFSYKINKFLILESLAGSQKGVKNNKSLKMTEHIYSFWERSIISSNKV